MPSPAEMTMPTMVAAISVLDSKSPRRLERPPVPSTAGTRVFGTGSFGSAGTVGATLRGTDEGGRAGRTTAPGRMSGESTPAALSTTPVTPPAAGTASGIASAHTIVFQAVAADEPAEEPAVEEPLVVAIDGDANAKPVKERRNRPLILATAGAGLTLAGAMLVGGWIAGPGGTPEPVSLSGGHAAPQEPSVTDPGEQAEVLATEGHFSGILPIAATKQAAPQTATPKAPAASSSKKTTQQAAPKQTQRQPTIPRVQMPEYQVPRFDLPDYTPPRHDHDHDRDWGDRDWERDGRHHR